MGNVPPAAVTGGKGEPFWQELDVFWAVWGLWTGVLPPTLDALLSLARLIGAVHHQDEKGESPTRRLLSKNYYDLFKDNLVAE